MTITWAHSNVTGNADGIAWAGSQNGPGTHVAFGGGYAHFDSTESSTETSGQSATGMIPTAATYLEYDSGSDSTYLVVGFAVPEGMRVRAHVWWAD